MNATDLQNANSDGNGFSVNTQASTISFGFIAGYGNSGNMDNGSGIIQYLMPGTVSHQNTPTAPYAIYFPKPCIIFGGTASFICSNSGSSRTIDVKFYKNAPGTAFLTINLVNSSVNHLTVSGVSANFLTTDYLVVEAITSNFSSSDDVILTVLAAVY